MLCCVLLLSLSATLVAAQSVATNMLVVDWGSTGSEIRCYTSESIGNVVPCQGVIIQSWRVEDVVDQLDNVSRGIDAVLATFPKERRHIPVYVGATGIYRALIRTEQDKIRFQEPIETALKTTHVRVLSGEEEAAFGVLALLASVRNQPSKWPTRDDPGIGWLDFGGYSLEIGWLTSNVIAQHFFALPPILSPIADGNIFAQAIDGLGWKTLQNACLSAPIVDHQNQSVWTECRQRIVDRLPGFSNWSGPQFPRAFVAISGLSYLYRTLLLPQQQQQQQQQQSLGLGQDNQTYVVSVGQLRLQLEEAAQGACRQHDSVCTGLSLFSVILDLFQFPAATDLIFVPEEQEPSWTLGLALFRNWQLVVHAYVVSSNGKDNGIWSTLSILSGLINVLFLATLMFFLGRRQGCLSCCTRSTHVHQRLRPYATEPEQTQDIEAEVRTLIATTNQLVNDDTLQSQAPKTA